jgi:hypothetical protein
VIDEPSSSGLDVGMKEALLSTENLLIMVHGLIIHPISLPKKSATK